MNADAGRSRSGRLQMTPDPEWVKEIWKQLTPFKDEVVHHIYFREMGRADLDLTKFRRLLLEWYSLIEAFPMYLAMNLARLARYSGPGRTQLRNWLIVNLKVELKHANWWEDWAEGFGISPAELRAYRPCPEVEAVQKHIEVMADRGAVFEALGATNIAMEWPTSEWARGVIDGVKKYGDKQLARTDEKTVRWLKEHAAYDDFHPFEAMELIKLTTTNAEERERAVRAAERGLELVRRALTATYEGV